VARGSVDELADGMISDITRGIAGTDVRAGIIGEIGVSPLKIHPDEAKVLRAAAKAHKETGLPIAVHSWPFSSERNVAAQVLDLLEGCDVNLKWVALCHMDWARDWTDLVKLAERGAFVQFSSFGADFPFLICGWSRALL
jgi:phosphotriesterase-related protein